jgi:nucleoside-diphosphate-sugar epimerase
MRVLIAGAGGFIGGHLTKRLLNEGADVRAVDLKPFTDWWQIHKGADNWAEYDLRVKERSCTACCGQEHVYNLAADMGGIGFIERHKAACMQNVLINTHMLLGSRAFGISRYFFASSACVYHARRQQDYGPSSLQEQDAYHNGGAMPEDGYGWEKLFAERMCRHFAEDYGLETRVARYHNIYGPHGSWCDGREKAPAAICRKICQAKLEGTNEIEVWGDGTQRRSFCWIDDCVEGTRRLMDSSIRQPLNIGSAQIVTVDDLIREVEGIAEVPPLRRRYVAAPTGVAVRSSDNALIRDCLGWEPRTPLAEGLTLTYAWIEHQLKRAS